MTPLVSVIVPTNNRRKFLQETLESILSQTVRDLELIVVDNMSQDGTEEYLKELEDPRIRYFRNPNKGIISTNRNFGIGKARAKYVAFCDDDDLWFPNKLEKQLDLFPEDGISCVSSDFMPIGGRRPFYRAFRPLDEKKFRDFDYEEIALLNPVISSSVVTRKDFLLEVGGFDENPDFRCIEDWELWLRLSQMGGIRVLNEPLLKYRISIKTERDERTIALNTLKILEKHRQLGYLSPEIFRQAQGNCFVSIGKAFLDKNDRQGLAFFKRGLVESRSRYQQLKALAGILLFYFPSSWRIRFLDFLVNP